MRSRFRVDARRWCPLLVAALVCGGGLAAKQARAQNEVTVIALPTLRPNEVNPFGLWMTGQTAPATGAKVAFLADLRPLFSGGQPAVYELSAVDNSEGISVSGAQQVGGRIGDQAAFFYFSTPTSYQTLTLGRVAGVITSFVRVTDGELFLLHVDDPSGNFLPDSAVGRLDTRTGALNLVWADDVTASFDVFFDIAGSSLVGGTYSKVVSGARFPLRAAVKNGALTALQTALPQGFTNGSHGVLFFTDESGNAAGMFRRVGGAFEAALVMNDGTSMAFGIPTGFDYAYAVGVFGDMLIANAVKSDTNSQEAFALKLAPGSTWTKLADLLGTSAGWTSMSASTVTPFSIIGAGTRGGATSGFLVIPQSLVTTTPTSTLTKTAQLVTGGNPFQVTFKFVNDATKPQKAARLTLSDPIAAAFKSGPTGSALLDNGKTLLVPLADNQTEVVVELNTSATIDRDREVRIGASTSATASPSLPSTFVTDVLTVRKP